MREFIPYDNEEQFAPAAADLAEQAAAEAMRLEQLFGSLREVASVLASDATHGRVGWSAFHAAVMLGCVGEGAAAAAILQRVVATPGPPGSVLDAEARRLLTIVSDQARMRDEVAGRVARQRRALRLSPWQEELADWAVRDHQGLG